MPSLIDLSLSSRLLASGASIGTVVGSILGNKPPLNELPKTDHIFAHWRARDIDPTTADNALIPLWTDTVSGLVASQDTAAKQPKYRRNAMGGQPGIVFDGNRYFPVTSNSEFDAKTSAFGWSMVIIASAIDWANSPTEACPAGSINGLWPNLGQPGIGQQGFGGNLPGASKVGSNLFVGVWEQHADLGFHFAQGSAYVQSVRFPTGPFSGGFFIGAIKDAYPSGNFAGIIHEIIMYDSTMYQPDVDQIVKYACDLHSQQYPWHGLPYKRLFMGDSQTASYGGTGGRFSYPYLVAEQMGIPLGGWSQLGLSTFSINGLETPAQLMVDPLPAITGIPNSLAFFEWYNEARFQNNGDIHGIARSFLQNRQSANPTSKITFGTNVDSGNAQVAGAIVTTGRAANNAYWDNSVNRAGLIDAYVALHSDSRIGPTGAAPPQGAANSYFADDSIHFTDGGEAVVKALFAAQMIAAGL